jgi:hypothetical protein
VQRVGKNNAAGAARKGSIRKQMPGKQEHNCRFTSPPEPPARFGDVSIVYRLAEMSPPVRSEVRRPSMPIRAYASSASVNHVHHKPKEYLGR